jgi:hypothetical protein
MNPDDNMRQILRIGAVYSYAQLTIIAAAGLGPQHGFPAVSEARRKPIVRRSLYDIYCSARNDRWLLIMCTFLVAWRSGCGLCPDTRGLFVTTSVVLHR